MKNFKEIKAEEINENTFEIIEKKCSFYFYSSSAFH